MYFQTLLITFDDHSLLFHLILSVILVVSADSFGNSLLCYSIFSPAALKKITKVNTNNKKPITIK